MNISQTPQISSSFKEAKFKSHKLYRDILRAIPSVKKQFHLQISFKDARKRIRQEFVKNAHVTDPTTIDLLVFKGRNELEEALKSWKTASHVLASLTPIEHLSDSTLFGNQVKAASKEKFVKYEDPDDPFPPVKLNPFLRQMFTGWVRRQENVNPAEYEVYDGAEGEKFRAFLKNPEEYLTNLVNKPIPRPSDFDECPDERMKELIKKFEKINSYGMQPCADEFNEACKELDEEFAYRVNILKNEKK